MDSILMNSVTFQRNDKLPQEMDSILMSSSEKQWVTKIQMLQIQTANPYEEDYYYQVGILVIVMMKLVLNGKNFLSKHPGLLYICAKVVETKPQTRLQTRPQTRL